MSDRLEKSKEYLAVFAHKELTGPYVENLRWLISQVETLREELIAVRSAVVQTIGGIVEGQPTHEGNYLQRLRELVAIEKDSADAFRQNSIFYASLDANEKDNAQLRAEVERLRTENEALRKLERERWEAGEKWLEGKP